MTLTKLTIKSKRNLSLSYKQMSVDAILVICSLLKRKARKSAKSSIVGDRDNEQRMQVCLKILTKLKDLKGLTEVHNILIQYGRAIFAEFLKSHSKLLPSSEAIKRK